MTLSAAWLQERHNHWRLEIAKAGIWDSGLFFPVEIIVRPYSRTREGFFVRRSFLKLLGVRHEDKIIVYRNDSAMTPKDYDSVLVHEMIHQYIIQNSLPDTSAHGKRFKAMMSEINKAFPHELHLSVTRKAPALSGHGDKTHDLLVVHMRDGFWYCCRLLPSSVNSIIRKVRENRQYWGVLCATHCTSDSRYFLTVKGCRTNVHGLKKTRDGMEDFCREHFVRPTGCPPGSNPMTAGNVIKPDRL